MHWIGTQFGICRILESRDKSLSKSSFVGTTEENEQFTNSQNTQFGLVMWKHTMII